MAEVKALFPIGKTQWRKWTAEQRMEFNDACAGGLTPDKAIAHVNAIDWVKVTGFFPEPEQVPAAPKKASPKKKAK